MSAPLLLAWLALASTPAPQPATTTSGPHDVYALEDTEFVAQAQRDLQQLER